MALAISSRCRSRRSFRLIASDDDGPDQRTGQSSYHPEVIFISNGVLPLAVVAD